MGHTILDQRYIKLSSRFRRQKRFPAVVALPAMDLYADLHILRTSDRQLLDAKMDIAAAA